MDRSRDVYILDSVCIICEFLSSSSFLFCFSTQNRQALSVIFDLRLIPTPWERDVAPWRDGSSDRSFMVDPLTYFSFQPVLHDWCNKCRGMYYPVCGMMHIKEPLLLIGKSGPCGGSGFPLSLSEWSFTICLTPYIRK